MSNKREKETGKERHSSGGISTGRSLNITARKSRATTVPSHTNKIKKPEESSEDTKRSTKAGVSKNEPRKSGAKTVSTGVWRARASAEALQATATVSANASPAVIASLAKKEAKVGHEKSQVTRTPKIERRPDLPANKIAAKTASPQQVWREKTKPESSDTEETSARKQQSQHSGGTSKPPTKTTNSGSLTSKRKKSASKTQFSRKEPLPKDQSSQRKKVQNTTHNKASTSRVNSESASNPKYYIEWNGFDEPDNRIGVCCSLCEGDLGVEPEEDNDEDEYSTIPIVAILPCGHAFHNICLNVDGFQGQPDEPSCVLCESLVSC